MSKLMARASWLALTIALAGAFSAHAADGDDSKPTTVSGVTVLGAQETIRTAPAAPPLSTPYSETTISHIDVQNMSSGATVSLQTMLVNQPSVFAYNTGPLGTGGTIFYRAFNSGEFAQTFDGVALNDIFNGGVTGQASTFDSIVLIPYNIDSIELYHGINNPAVNSYNSLGGTINYLARLPSATPGGEIGGGYGSFDTSDFHVALNSGDWNGIRQTLTFSHGESSGWTPNTSARNTNVYYAGSYDGANGDHLNVILAWDRSDAHTPFDMPAQLLQANGGFYQWPSSVAYEKDKDTRFLGIVYFSAPWGPHVVVDNKVFGGFYDYVRTSYANPAYDESASQPYEIWNQSTGFNYWQYYPNGPTYDPKALFGSVHNGTDYHYYNYDTWGIGEQPTVTITAPYNKIVVGGNITIAGLKSREYWYGDYNMPLIKGYNDAWDEYDTRTLASAFIQDDIKLFHDTLSITPGIKWLYARTEDNDAIGFYYPYQGTVHDTETAWSPTIGVNWQPIQNFSVNFAFGQSVRFPDISAYYGDVPANTAPTGAPVYAPAAITIKPEKVNDFELGAKYQQGGFAAELNLYRVDINHLFVDAYDGTTGETVVSNGGSARYQGVELRLTEDWKTDHWGDFRGFVNFSYRDAKYTSSFCADTVGTSLSQAGGYCDPYNVFAGEPMPDVPKYLVSAGATWDYRDFTAQLTARYIGQQYIIDEDDGAPDANRPTLPGYVVADLHLAKRFEIKGAPVVKWVKVSFDIDNLFNKYYIQFSQTSYYDNYNFQQTFFEYPGAPRSFFGKIDVGF